MVVMTQFTKFRSQYLMTSPGVSAQSGGFVPDSRLLT